MSNSLPPSKGSFTATLVKQGLKSFRAHEYQYAIQIWREVLNAPNAPPTLAEALAEAHFRLALLNPASFLDYLQHAIELNPSRLVYHYHLALVYHREHRLDEAEAIYRQLLAATPPYERAALPLGQLLVAQQRPLLQDPVWKLLSLPDQVVLVVAEALINGKPTPLLQKLMKAPQLNPIWQGLLAFNLRRFAQAAPLLGTASDSSSYPIRVILNYYEGLAWAASHDLDRAFATWKLVPGLEQVTDSFTTNWNQLCFQKSLQAYHAHQWTEALAFFNQIQYPQYIKGYSDFKQILFWAVGYDLAQQGKWSQALEHWQVAGDIRDDRRLLFNLAIAHQKVGHHIVAANLWRGVLRYRPRRTDHADALTEEQIAWIWQNAAEQYSLGGNYEEAIKTYRNAIKWNPHHLNLRLKLAEAYHHEGRWIAANNELQRILREHPKHVPALLLMAEVLHTDSRMDLSYVMELWQRVLQLEPENPIAQTHLVTIYAESGYACLREGASMAALENFQNGLVYQPNNPELCVGLAMTQAYRGQFSQAKATFDHILSVAPQNLNIWLNMYVTWLHHKRVTELAQVVAKIKQLNPLTGEFFIELIKRALEYHYVQLAEELMQFMEVRFAADEAALVLLASCYNEMQRETKAMNILQAVLARNPHHAAANMRLGQIYYQNHQPHLAQRHWEVAEAQGKRENNQILLYELQTLREFYLHGRPTPQNVLDFITRIPDEALEELIQNAPPDVAELLRQRNPEVLKQVLIHAGLLEDSEE